jgi:hypothetical protein
MFINLTDHNLNVIHENGNQSKSDKQNLCQIEDYGVIVSGNEDPKIVGGSLNSEFLSHSSLFNHIPKLSRAEVNVGSEIFQSKQTKTKLTLLMITCNFKQDDRKQFAAKVEP